MEDKDIKAYKKKFPTLAIDNKEIIENRKLVQKTWEDESFYPWIFLRRISIYISTPIAKYTNISPNSITIFGIIIGLITSFLFLRLQSIYHVYAVFLYQIIYLADCVDGEVARLTNKKSSIGNWLDSALRYTLYSAFFSVVSTNLYIYNFKYNRLFEIILIISILVSILTTDNNRLPKLDHDTNKRIKKKSFLLDFLIFQFATDPGFYLIYLGLIMFRSSLILYWVLFYSLVFILKTYFRLYTIIKGVK